MKINNTVLAGIIFVLWCVPLASWAQIFGSSENDLIKTRTYVGGVGISSTIDQWDDFNGTHGYYLVPAPIQTDPVTLWASTDLNLVPAIERNFGWGVLVGHREGPWAAEVSYWMSNHTATFSSGITTTSSLNSIDFNLKRYFLTQLPTQPFVNLGLSFPWLWVHNGSYLIDYPSFALLDTSDESISGIGFILGAGMEIYLGENYSIVGGISQRWAEYNQMNGAAKQAENKLQPDSDPNHTGSLAGKGLSFYLGATIGFQ
jgi:hypothetical protein